MTTHLSGRNSQSAPVFLHSPSGPGLLHRAQQLFPEESERRLKYFEGQPQTRIISLSRSMCPTKNFFTCHTPAPSRYRVFTRSVVTTSGPSEAGAEVFLPAALQPPRPAGQSAAVTCGELGTRAFRTQKVSYRCPGGSLESILPQHMSSSPLSHSHFLGFVGR